MIDQILEYNRRFVEDKGYERFATDKYPDKKIAIVAWTPGWWNCSRLPSACATVMSK